MTVLIEQEITQTDQAEYEVSIKVDGEELQTRIYKRCNAVFPVYHTLGYALRSVEDCDVLVVTNSEPLVREFNSLPNPNATMLTNLRQLIAQQGLNVTIKNN